MALDDLTSEMPDEEQLKAFPALLAKESDRASAIMASALVEQALYVTLTSHLADPGGTTQKDWFYGQSAPFGSFDAKIRLGRALAIYEEGMENRLTIIRKIRNVFAHRSLPLDFTHEALKDLCMQLTPTPERDRDKKMRVIFGGYCLAVVRVLITDSFRCGGKDLTICIPEQRE